MFNFQMSRLDPNNVLKTYDISNKLQMVDKLWVETHFYIFLKVIIGGFKILYNILILCKTKFDIVAKLYTPIECDLLIGVKPTGFV